MINITTAELHAQGFTLVDGAGERIQVWSGKDANNYSVMYGFDNVRNKAIAIDGYDTKVLLLLAILSKVADLIQNGIPSGGPAKTAAIQVMLDAAEYLG